MSERGPMPTVTYDGKVYKLRSRKTEIPDLGAMERMAALIWINQNTTKRGAGTRTQPNPLRGLGEVLSVRVH